MMAHDSQQHNAGTARAYSSTQKELAYHFGQMLLIRASYRASPLPAGDCFRERVGEGTCSMSYSKELNQRNMDSGRQGNHLLRNRALLIKELDQKQKISEAQGCQA